MFSSSLATATEALRPGLISGRYPERSDPDRGWIERVFSVLQGQLTRLNSDRQSGLRKGQCCNWPFGRSI
ncbi:MAG: hypothetical protein GY850_23640 [bacterium]|nr:hypothetical protein [bacterium]